MGGKFCLCSAGLWLHVEADISFCLHQQLISFGGCLTFLQKKQYQYRRHEISYCPVPVKTVKTASSVPFFRTSIASPVSILYKDVQEVI